MESKKLEAQQLKRLQKRRFKKKHFDPAGCKGHSSPIVFDNVVYALVAVPVGKAQEPVYDDAPGVHDSVPVTHRHQFLALVIDRRDGRIWWLKVLCEKWLHEGGHVTGSLASNSPATDGERLYVLFEFRGLYCLELVSLLSGHGAIVIISVHGSLGFIVNFPRCLAKLMPAAGIIHSDVTMFIQAEALSLPARLCCPLRPNSAH